MRALAILLTNLTARAAPLWITLSRLKGVLGVACLVSIQAENVLAVSVTAGPKIFFYPPPAKLGDGSTVATVPTLTVQEMTTQFPQVREMSGVALVVNWAQLCPTSNYCNFLLINQVLSYWHQRRKKVVLAVATVGFPYKVLENAVAHFRSANPDCVLDKVITYKAPVRAFGRINNDNRVVARFPSYADPRFVEAIADLVHQLAQFTSQRSGLALDC